MRGTPRAPSRPGLGDGHGVSDWPPFFSGTSLRGHIHVARVKVPLAARGANQSTTAFAIIDHPKTPNRFAKQAKDEEPDWTK
jgi:hypothetical protein